jgi:hypothetical protein
MRSALVLDPAPFVTRWRKRTVAKRGLDHIRRPDVLPMLRREAVGREELLRVSLKRCDGLRILRAVRLRKYLQLFLRDLSRLGLHDLVERALGLALQSLGSLSSTLTSR